MMKLRKILSIFLALVMTVSMFAMVASAKNPFTDVPEGEFYYDPVMWAIDNNITKGMTETTFEPNLSCTRGQVVTFLWRAFGEPVVTGENKFTDVASSAYYYNAVIWAVSKGITNGMSETTFEPETPCTRGQVVTFLWRAAGKPEATGKNVFTDVVSGQYYYDAVLWAVAQGITNGMDATSFGPDGSCTRAHIVTFLYRFFAKNLIITQQPEEFFAYDGDSVKVSLKVVGGKGKLTYTWEYWDMNWYELPSNGNLVHNGASLHIIVRDNMGYTHGQFRCVVKDEEGNTVTSDEIEGHLLVNKQRGNNFGMYVDDVFNIKDRGIVFKGKILSGSVKLGDKLWFRYNDDRGISTVTGCKVEGIEMFNKNFDEAKAGDTVGILIGYPWGKNSEGVPNRDAGIERGIFLYKDGEAAPSHICGTYVGTLTLAPTSESGHSTPITSDTLLNFNGFSMDTNSKLLNLSAGQSVLPGQTVENAVLEFDRARVLFVGDQLTVRLGGRTLGTFVVEKIIFD